jgi:hypothetical protein
VGSSEGLSSLVSGARPGCAASKAALQLGERRSARLCREPSRAGVDELGIPSLSHAAARTGGWRHLGGDPGVDELFNLPKSRPGLTNGLTTVCPSAGQDELLFVPAHTRQWLVPSRWRPR